MSTWLILCLVGSIALLPIVIIGIVAALKEEDGFSFCLGLCFLLYLIIGSVFIIKALAIA